MYGPATRGPEAASVDGKIREVAVWRMEDGIGRNVKGDDDDEDDGGKDSDRDERRQ